jgi:hypothetical protein
VSLSIGGSIRPIDWVLGGEGASEQPQSTSLEQQSTALSIECSVKDCGAKQAQY